MSIRYSYPPFFIEELIKNYGTLTAQTLLESGNRAAPIIVRIRSKELNAEKMLGMSTIISEPFPMAELTELTRLTEISNSPEFYIQNATPATLLGRLCNMISPPHSILDFCAAPGGKIIAAHDLFPQAALFANDISEEKLDRLRQNLAKYKLNVEISCSQGELFHSLQKFDMIIVDAPCSNSGVLNKRPEARWRLSEDSLKALDIQQFKLIENAVKFLNPEGTLCYLTCSVLKRENEDLIRKACEDYNLKLIYQETILPNLHGCGWGYSCLLKKGEHLCP